MICRGITDGTLSRVTVWRRTVERTATINAGGPEQLPYDHGAGLRHHWARSAVVLAKRSRSQRPTPGTGTTPLPI
jgi:hypothetical protein